MKKEKLMNAMLRANLSYLKAKKKVLEKLQNTDGDANVGTVITILITVVVGSILLTAIIAIIGDDSTGLLGQLSQKIQEMLGLAK